MKRLALLSFFLFTTLYILAQNNTKNISGTVIDDKTKQPIELASIRLLTAKDSSYVTGTASNENGNFNIAAAPQQYIIELSFLGYKTKYVTADTRNRNASLGEIHMSEDGVLLGEAVVTAKAIDIQVKGDTVEYNADSYNVQKSAVLEDLVKKIPGAEVDENGKITINGKEITRILVDGKEFFSDDPKVASKNLPASMIEKLQVLDKKSEMAEMTGFDDGNEETVINLTVKPGMKEGLFGTALAGYGSEKRYEGNGTINYMKNNSQITGIAGINNTNNAGFTDFASTMLGGGGPPRGVRFGGSNGVAKTANAGLNFATEKKDRIKLNGDFRYGMVDNDVSTISNKQYTGTPRNENSSAWGNNKSQNFGANMRIDWTPDSLTRIIFRPNFQYNKNQNSQISNMAVTNVDNPLIDTEEDQKYYTDGNGVKLDGNLWISRKLNSKGRSISLRLGGGFSNADNDGSNYSITKFTQNLNRADSVIDQRFSQDDKSHNWKADLSYIEPLGRNNFLEIEYEIENNRSETNKNAFLNNGNDIYNVIDTASTRRVKNDFLSQEISVAFQSIRKKFNYTIGLGLEPSSSKTEIINPDDVSKIVPRKNYLNITPHARLNYIWSKQHNLRVDYRGKTSQATTLQLYDGIISQSGFNKTIGNPNLKPSFQHKLDLRYQKFVSEKGASFLAFGRFNYNTNDIVSVATYDGVYKTNTYQNVDGNLSGNLRWIMNLPLRNRRFSFNSMTYGGFTRSNTFITEMGTTDPRKNTANIYRVQENGGLRFTSNKDDIISPILNKIDFSVRGNIIYNKVNNSISTNSNQETYDYGGYADVTFYFPFDIRVDTDMNYSTNSGYGEGFKRNEWLWNAAMSMDFLKAKNATVRFKIYDILQQRSNITRNIAADYIEDVTTNTINSYFMVNLVFRFQSFKGGAKMSDMQMPGPGGPGGPGGRPPR